MIRRVLLSEKNTIRSEKYNEYFLEVDKKANRSEIKKTIEKEFDVKVVRVNTMICRTDPKRLGRKAGTGKRTLWKKAVIKLQEGHKLEMVGS